MGITVVIIKYIYTLLLCDFFLVDYLFSFDCTFHIALKKLPRMVIFSIIIKSVTWCLGAGFFVYCLLYLSIFISFWFSKNKDLFIINLILILVFWDIFSLVCDGNSNNHNNSSSFFNTNSTGSNSSGGGPNPPQWDSSMATSASGSSLNQPDCGDHYDTDARSSGEYTDRSLGSMVDKNDYVKYSKKTNTFYVGGEKDGFISKAHERVYYATEARIAVLKELEANPSNPLVQVSHTG